LAYLILALGKVKSVTDVRYDVVGSIHISAKFVSTRNNELRC
jgi:hypothetical protein